MNILRNTLTFTVGFQALYTLELYTSVGVPVGWPWHYVKITRASESKTASCMIFSSKVLIQSSMIVTYMGTITQFFLCVIGMYLKTADDLAKTLILTFWENIYMKSLKLYMVTTSKKLPIFIPVLVTLIKFQGHSGIGKLKLKTVSFSISY